MWLARELSTSETWRQRFIVTVSHDRHFLDEVCSDCLHISGASRRLTQSKGNYSMWAKRRSDEQALFEKEQAKRQAEIDTLREYAGHGFKYGGSSSQINKMQMKAKQGTFLCQWRLLSIIVVSKWSTAVFVNCCSGQVARRTGGARTTISSFAGRYGTANEDFSRWRT
jgi:hypothetical protein